jgi:myo-inositol-1(or 4)-monophosphatase
MSLRFERPWDVCAGIVIAQEAGAIVTGSHAILQSTSVEEHTFGDVTEEILTGRKYTVIRAIKDSPDEMAILAQERILKEFYETVEDMEPC